MDAIEQSICIYQALLADVAKSYSVRGGGGISGITQNSSTSYTVKIAQEGRSDLLTYQVEIGGEGKVKITGRTERAESH